MYWTLHTFQCARGQQFRHAFITYRNIPAWYLAWKRLFFSPKTSYAVVLYSSSPQASRVSRVSAGVFDIVHIMQKTGSVAARKDLPVLQWRTRGIAAKKLTRWCADHTFIHNRRPARKRAVDADTN